MAHPVAPPSVRALPRSIRPRRAGPRRRPHMRAALAVLAAVALAGTAMAAANTFPPSNAGQGVDVVAGFEVTDVSYDADPTTQGAGQAKVVGVDFAIARSGPNAALPVTNANAKVFVQLRDGAGSSAWAACSVGSGASSGQAQCATTGPASIDVEDLVQLSVVAYDA